MKDKKTSAFVASIVMSVVWLVIANTLPAWRHVTQNVILPSWVNVLWAINIAGGVSILGNLLLAYYRPARLRSFFEILFAASSLLTAVVLYIVFPIDFSLVAGPWLNTLFRALFIVGMGGASIAIIVHFVQFLSGTGAVPSPVE